MTDTDTEELADLAPDVDSYESAALLLIKGGTDRFRSLSFFNWEALQMAFCFMFQCGVKLTLRRISEFLIFLLPEARSRSEEDVQQGESLTQMHGKIQQTAVVLVESLREADQEMLWCSQEGLTILMQLQLGDARLFFARPRLQRIMCDLWRGVRPDSYAQSFWKQLQVWARLLLYSGPNIAILIFWAVVPALEEWMHELSILAADKGRQDEAAYWEGKRKNGKSQSTGDCERSDDWPCKVGDRMCWNETNFRHALREECRRKVFEIQSRLPLLLPCNRKYLAILTNLLFVAYLIAETPDGANVRTVLMLTAGAWLGEVRQLFAFAGDGSGASYSMSFWFMDRVNVMELVAFTCIAWTSVLCLIEPEHTELAQQFKALGVLFLGISQSMALLRMSSVFGPLISMTMSMILDLLHWMMLLFPIVACLVAALMTLFKSRTGVEQENCLPFGFDYVQGVLRFFEIQIGEEVPLGCLRDDSPHPWFGQIIMNLGLWMILILMLNMLIAMMAKTFDRIYEGAMVDFQYHFIGNLLQMVSEPAVPPVLRTLCVPWMLLSILPSCCTRFSNFLCHFCGKRGLCGLCGTCGTKGRNGETEASEAGRLWKMGSTEKSSGSVALRHSFLQMLKDPKNPKDPKESDSPSLDLADLAVQSRFVPDADFKLLSDRVEDFVVEHAADTQVQDALWRKQIARQLFVMDCKLTSLASLAEEMQTLRKLKRHRQ